MTAFIIVLFVVFLAAIEVGKQLPNFAIAFATLLLASYVCVHIAQSPGELAILLFIILTGIIVGRSYSEVISKFLAFRKDILNY